MEEVYEKEIVQSKWVILMSSKLPFVCKMVLFFKRKCIWFCCPPRFAIRKIMLLEFRLVVLHFVSFYYCCCSYYYSFNYNPNNELKWISVSHSQYLENYLWVNYTEEVSSNAYLMSICCIVNEKFRENVPAWEVSCVQFFMKRCHQKLTLTWCQLCTL